MRWDLLSVPHDAIPGMQSKPTLDEQRHTLRLLDVLDKRVLLLAERVLVHQSRVTENIRRQVVN